MFGWRKRSENQELLKELQQVRRRKQPLHIVCREVRVVKKLLLDNSPIAKREPITFRLNALSELVAALDQLSELIQWDLRVAEDHLGENRGVVEEEIQLVEVFQSISSKTYHQIGSLVASGAHRSISPRKIEATFFSCFPGSFALTGKMTSLPHEL